jgi:putative colanic acid biosynthesis acetyltransferase WcaF
MRRAVFSKYSHPRSSSLEKIYLQFWQIAQFFLYNIPVQPLNGFRVLLLRAFGATVGRNVIIRPGVRIYNPRKLVIENGVWVGERAWIYNFDFVFLKKNCVISQETVLCTASHDYSSEYFETTCESITIGEGSWVCIRAIVLQGSFVAPREIVSANSVKNKKNNEISIY